MIIALDNCGSLLTLLRARHEPVRNHTLPICFGSRDINLPDRIALQQV
jgi:hypothetical protein